MGRIYRQDKANGVVRIYGKNDRLWAMRQNERPRCDILSGLVAGVIFCCLLRRRDLVK